jgi:hypothetical protein
MGARTAHDVRGRSAMRPPIILSAILLTACGLDGEDELAIGEVTEAITNGSPDLDTQVANATVQLPGCTGTLVAPDIVLTAAHCIDRVNDEGCTATELPNRWYPLQGDGMSVNVGRDSVGVNVNRINASIWETFTLFKLANGTGSIRHGDSIHFRTHDGVHFLSADGEGGKWIDAIRPWAAESETFTIERVAGDGVIASGDEVRLRAKHGQFLVLATDTVGDVLHATGGPAPTANASFEIRLANNGTGTIAAGANVHLKSKVNSRYVVAEEGGGAWKHVARARYYSIPNGVDIALIKLEAPVPSGIALPSPVLTRLFADPFTFWPTQTVRLAGWGGTNLPALVAGRYRQTMMSPNLRFGCQWDGRTHLCIDSNTNIAGGDSGGPLYWSSGGQTQVVGVVNGEVKYIVNGQAVSANPRQTYHQDTTTVGGFSTCNGTRTLPNVAIWLETMLAMRPQCALIDAPNAFVEGFAGGFRIRSASSVLETNFRTISDAERALALMRHYQMTERCMVGNTVEYNLSSAASPTGAPLPGEDCIDIWAPGLTVVNQGGSWTLRQGSSSLLSLGTSETIARLTLGTVQRYDFRALCFVARPNPAWTYFRR